MTAGLNLETLASIFAGRMANSVAEGIAVALLAWVLLQALGRRNSSTRFAVWFVALLVIGVLPWLGLLAPSAPGGMARPAITLPSSWALDWFAIWALIASAGLARVGVGLWQLRKLRRDCTPINTDSLDPMLRQTLLEFRSTRPVALCVSDSLRVPTALGFLDPMIVIPAWAIEELSPAELNSILIHELAHLQRRDDWTNLAQKIVRALLFFHPAVWWIERKLSLEREMACDDVVLAETSNPRAYAQCLVSLTEKSFMRRGLALAQAAATRMRQTSLRVTQILRGKRSGAAGVWKPAVYLAAALFALCVISVSRTPELVAFESGEPSVTASSISSTSHTAVTLLATNSVQLAKETAATRLIDSPTGHPTTVHPKNAGLTMTKVAVAKRSNVRQDSAEAEVTLPEPNSGNLVQAKMVVPNETFASERAVLVVMRSQQYSASGTTFWTICVWHVTVFEPGPAAVKTRNPAKSI